MKLFTRLPVIILFIASTVGAQTKTDTEYRSYLAHIAAASQSLRLYDTAEAKRWLAAAPVKYRGWEWHYLNTRSEQSAATYSNSDSATAIAISPDGRLVATTSTDKTVRILNAVSGVEILNKPDEKMTPQSVVFSPDGKRLAAAYSRHAVRVWDVSGGAELLKLQGKGRGITAIAYSPDGKILASCSWRFNEKQEIIGIVEIWNAETGEPVRELTYGVKPLTAIAFSPDGKYLAVGSWEVQKTVAMWETSKWGEPLLLESEADDSYKAVQSIAFSPDSTKLAAGGKDSIARIWDVASGKRLHTLRGHAKWVNGVYVRR
jgi:WD40 repeat protein